MEIALDQKRLEEWRTALMRVAAFLAEPETAAILENTRVPFNLKRQLIEDRLKGADPMAVNLALLLTQRGLPGIGGQVLAAYQDLLNERQGVATAQVTTAVPIDDGEKQHIASYLSGLTGKKVTVEAHVDPAVVGGVIARVGDTLFDGTIRRRLEQLKRTLA